MQSSESLDAFLRIPDTMALCMKLGIDFAPALLSHLNKGRFMNLLKRIFVPLSIFYVLMFGSFTNAHQAGQDDDTPHHPNRTVRLATTTSTYHSGLLNHLLPQLEVDTGLQKILAAGTGKARSKWGSKR